ARPYRCLRASAFDMGTYAASHGKEEDLMTHARKLMGLLLAVSALLLGAFAVTASGAASTPEETVKAYLAAMKDQKFDEAYKQISKGMAGNKDAEAWGKEQK